MAHQPVADQVGDGADGLLQRHLGVGEVRVVQVDDVRTEGAQGLFRVPRTYRGSTLMASSPNAYQAGKRCAGTPSGMRKPNFLATTASWQSCPGFSGPGRVRVTASEPATGTE